MDGEETRGMENTQLGQSYVIALILMHACTKNTHSYTLHAPSDTDSHKLISYLSFSFCLYLSLSNTHTHTHYPCPCDCCRLQSRGEQSSIEFCIIEQKLTNVHLHYRGGQSTNSPLWCVSMLLAQWPRNVCWNFMIVSLFQKSYLFILETCVICLLLSFSPQMEMFGNSL